MSKQLNLFGKLVKVKTKKYVCYKNPKDSYESVVERFCLRRRKENPHEKKSEMVTSAQEYWKEVGKDAEKVKEFIKLRPSEKDFVR